MLPVPLVCSTRDVVALAVLVSQPPPPGPPQDVPESVMGVATVWSPAERLNVASGRTPAGLAPAWKDTTVATADTKYASVVFIG
jgi:hypothetical protein